MYYTILIVLIAPLFNVDQCSSVIEIRDTRLVVIAPLFNTDQCRRDTKYEMHDVFQRYYCVRNIIHMYSTYLINFRDHTFLFRTNSAAALATPQHSSSQTTATSPPSQSKFCFLSVRAAKTNQASFQSERQKQIKCGTIFCFVRIPQQR